MGRPPLYGAPVFRFLPAEVAEMEDLAQQLTDSIFPSRFALEDLAEKFSASLDRAGMVPVKPKQVLNWFHNRRYSHRNKAARTAPAPRKMMPSGSGLQHAGSSRAPRSAQASSSSSGNLKPGKNSMKAGQLKFEAKSAKDGAWFDVDTFLSYRLLESGDLEVLVRLSGFGAADDEWVNLRRCVRQRSLPCKDTECVAVVPGDTILCFQESEEQALFFEANVVDVQRQRHDSRGCRCRFIVHYEHDQSEEIVPLERVRRQPEANYGLQILPAVFRELASTDVHTPQKVVNLELTPNEKNMAEQKDPKQQKMMGINTDEVTMVSNPEQEEAVGKTIASLPSEAKETCNNSGSGVAMSSTVVAPVVIEIDD